MEPPPQGSESVGLDTPPVSKNQLKKIKRQQEWEAKKGDWKAKRKEKTRERKLRKRMATNAEPETSEQTSLENLSALDGEQSRVVSKKGKHLQRNQVPITLVIDCGFDELMTDREIKSLGSQITRCYSDNNKAPIQTNLAICSFGGQLEARYDGVLAGQHRLWKAVKFHKDDFVATAERAQEWMRKEPAVKLAGSLAKYSGKTMNSEGNGGIEDVVYLSSDSPDTLTELQPYTTYVIGGLVDKNRHKGICYKRAMDRGVKTAKLPIGDYLQMTSRFVLATNHVVEIMLRWLELGDWGKSFLEVVPKRKGGTLKASLETPSEAGESHIDHEKEQENDEVGNRENNVEAPIRETPFGPMLEVESERAELALAGEVGILDTVEKISDEQDVRIDLAGDNRE